MSTRTLTFEIPEKLLVRLEYAGMSEEELLKDLQHKIETRIQHLAYGLETGEEGVCIECGVTWGWAQHVETCKYHPSRRPW